MPDAPPNAVSDPQRLDALERTGLLGTAPEASFDRFTQLAVDLLDVRAALISLVGPDRQFIKSSAGLEHLGVTTGHQNLPLPHSFAQLVVTSEKPVVINDAREDDRLQDTLEDVDELGILAYAAFPLRTSVGGHVLGSFCALSDAPHDWTEKELGILEGLSGAIVARMELQEAKEEAEAARQEAEAARQRAEEAQREAEQAQEAAEAANAAKSRFVANMSHELRTPLNSVIGYSEMFMEDPQAWEEERLRDGLGRIYNSGQELLGLINDVLDLSKAEAGRLNLSPETFALAPLVEQAAEEVRPMMKKNGNAFDIHGLGDAGEEVHTDKSKVRQILSNLLSNAAKYTREGTVTLRVRLRETQQAEAASGEETGGREIIFEVADTGIGMTEAEQEKIFEAFERAEDAQETGGTGLGLGITRNLCDMLGGRVDVESEKGVGSTFTARIPVDAPSESAGENGSEMHGKTPARSGPTVHAGNLVLVIDDDRDARILMRNHLREAGFEVETASTGAEGIEQARELRPMAVTLDVLMEEMDGWEVLTRLKSDPQLRHVPVIMASITPDEGRGFQLGATEHLIKPVDRDRLAELLQRHRRHRGSGGGSNEGEPASLSVLLIEDDQATRDVVRQVIEEEGGHQVRGATDGQDALKALREGLAPDLVLLDLMMPELNGFEFLEAARELLEGVPVVVLTAKALTDEDIRRLNGQVEQIIRKEHFTHEDLLREVRQRVSALQKHAQAENAAEEVAAAATPPPTDP